MTCCSGCDPSFVLGCFPHYPWIREQAHWTQDTVRGSLISFCICMYLTLLHVLHTYRLLSPTRVFSHSLRAVIQFLDGAGSKELSETAAHHTLFDFHEDIPGTYDPASEVEGALGANGLDPAGRSRSSSAAVTPGLATPPVFWGGAPPKDDKALASLSVPNGNAKSASK